MDQGLKLVQYVYLGFLGGIVYGVVLIVTARGFVILKVEDCKFDWGTIWCLSGWYGHIVDYGLLYAQNLYYLFIPRRTFCRMMLNVWADCPWIFLEKTRPLDLVGFTNPVECEKSRGLLSSDFFYEAVVPTYGSRSILAEWINFFTYDGLAQTAVHNRLADIDPFFHYTPCDASLSWVYEWWR